MELCISVVKSDVWETQQIAFNLANVVTSSLKDFKGHVAASIKSPFFIISSIKS